MGSFLDWLNPAKQAAEFATDTANGIVDVLQKLGVVELTPEQKDKIQAAIQERDLARLENALKIYQEETKGIQSARSAQVSILQDAPRWIKGIAALVVPYGGFAAITVFFANIIIPWVSDITGIPFYRIMLTEHEAYTIDGIMAFFFGYRLVQKAIGTAGKF